MNGVIEIKMPEIEELEEVFAENTTNCGPVGAEHS